MQPIDLVLSKLPDAELLSAALRYAELGYQVFPCIPGTKKPITVNGFHDAVTDPAQIERWWSRHPNANIGIPTEGLLVVDIDGTNNPWPSDPEQAADLAGAGAIAMTPRGGRHYLFRQPAGKHWRCSESQLAPKVDVRADGGYIVVAPSVTGDGAYTWAPGLELDGPPERLPEPPSWLASLLDALASVPGPTCTTTGPGTSNVIPEGQRNATLARLAGTMRRVGMGQAEITAALHQTNKDRCAPPLSPHEVERIAASIARYEPDQIATAMAEGHWDQLMLAQTPLACAVQPWQPTAKESRSRCQPDLVCLADVEPQKVPWLWYGRIPLGRLTLLVGRPGCGKSFVCCDLAARISTNAHWPEPGFDRAPLGDTLLICAEDDPGDTIRPRLDAAGANCRRVHLLKAAKILSDDGNERSVAFDLSNVDLIRDALDRLPECKLVVVDPIGSYLGGQVDAHRDNEVRSVLAPLAALAVERGVAVVLVCHTRKALASFADDMALGSRAFVGLARSVLHLMADPDDGKRKLLLPGKCNLSAPPPGLAFRIVGDPGRLEWEPDPLEGFRADDVVAPKESRENKRGPEPTTRDAASEWLADLLKDGPMPVVDIREQAKAADLRWRTIRRAQESLGIVPRKKAFGGGWEWGLPEGGQVSRRCPSNEKLGHLRENTGKIRQNSLEFPEGVQVSGNLDIFDGDVKKNLAIFDGDATNFPFGFNNPDDPDGERTYGSESTGEADNTVSNVDAGETATPVSGGSSLFGGYDPAAPDCKGGRLFSDIPRLPD
jgi:hypothetical protein